MSDSDSQSQQNFNLEQVVESEQPHIKEILEKGKKILPSYDEAALYALFKRYYCVDSIFYNELNMIARRSKGDFDNQGENKKNQQWIKIGRQRKTRVNKNKYNFLEDKQLLRRAEEYLKNKKLTSQKRPNFNDNRNTQNREHNTYTKPSYKENQNQPSNRPYEQRKPKQKFVQKVEQKKENKVQQKTSTQQKPIVNSTKVESTSVKEQKFKQKVQTQPSQPTPTQTIQTPAQPVLTQNNVEKVQPKQEQKKVQAPVPAKKQQKIQEAPKKEEKKVTEQTKKTQQPKYVQKIEKPVQKTVFVQKKQPVQTTQANKQLNETSKESKITSSHSIPTVQNFDAVSAAKKFQVACNQNSFILKFIQPQPYPQRISYVRASDGSMKNVQIRVTGTSSQGSQKAL